MNVSKTLSAFAAAAALVGTIGYASAQSGAGDTMAPNAGSPADTNSVQNQPVGSSSGTSTSGGMNSGTSGTSGTAGSGMSTSGTSSSVPSDAASTTTTGNTELAPQADRG